MNWGGKLGTRVAWLRDARGQTGPQLSSESESLASLVRRRRTAWTAEELAEVLSLSRKHIYKLAKKGRMPFAFFNHLRDSLIPRRGMI
jgi:excisionase family DNA binding protein